MPKPINATEQGLMSHYKVRIVLPGALLHIASWERPIEIPGGWMADWIDDHHYGDSIGYIDWTQVIAVTWRWTE